MNKKIIVSSLLLLTVILTGCSGQANSQNPAEKENPVAAEQSEIKEVSKVDKIEIIDFHSIRRCASCLGMEKNTKETLDKYFKNELESGKITFQTINVEESNPKNMALVQKYQATGSSLFINVIQNGEDHIEQDANAWRFALRDEQFQAYFKEKITNLLK